VDCDLYLSLGSFDVDLAACELDLDLLRNENWFFTYTTHY
jgi:hypothetical protein